ncbi:hypothetical protein ABE073_06485 [Lederbergia citrisecunda]|uniref:hypothetical protein n=1 Tax=Lederbergia citrisecunda TaxID=2833583 RepID=UPI003D2A76A8
MITIDLTGSMMMTLTTILTVMAGVAEDDVHVFNTPFSRFIHSTHHIHHTIAIHTTANHTTVLMAINT